MPNERIIAVELQYQKKGVAVELWCQKQGCSRVVVPEAQSGCSRRVPDEKIIAVELQWSCGARSGVAVEL